MKNLLLIAIFIIFSLTITAQVRDLSERYHFKKSDWEVSTSLALGFSAVDLESNPPEYYYYVSGEEEFYSEIAVTLGYFIANGFSVEPELNYNFFPYDNSLSVLLNISYTIHIPNRDVYPFFRIGIGKSGYHTVGDNYYNSGYPVYASEGLFGALDATLFNAAAGLKIIQSSNFAIRLELNYKYLLSDENYTQYDYNTQTTKTGNLKSTTSALSVKLGTSFLF